MRRLLVLVVLTASGLAIAATASAFTAKQKVSHSLTVCLRGHTLGGNGDGAGPIAAGSSLYLKIGYGATTRPEVNDFLAAQSGTFTVRDSGGNPVSSVSWPTASTQYWTAPKQAVLHNSQGQPLNGWVSTAYVPMGSFASGSYSVDTDIELSTQVFDGESYSGPGTWFTTTGCQMTVS